MPGARGGTDKRVEGKNSSKSDNEKPKWTDYVLVIFAGLALLISVWSWSISDNSARSLVNYTMQQQMSFDKKAAASQFSMEITTLSPALQQLCNVYTNNWDLASNGSNVRIYPKTVLMVYGESYKYTPYEIDYVNNSIVYAGQVYSTPIYTNGDLSYSIAKTVDPGTVVENCQLINTALPGELYDSQGMYYLYYKDLSKFNTTLSHNLYYFYTNLIRAEAEREYIQSYMDSHPNSSTLNGEYFYTYMDMRNKIMVASSLTPTILNELENEK